MCGYSEMICSALEHMEHTQTTRGYISGNEDGSFAATKLCNKRKRHFGAEHHLKRNNKYQGTRLLKNIIVKMCMFLFYLLEPSLSLAGSCLHEYTSPAT